MFILHYARVSIQKATVEGKLAHFINAEYGLKHYTLYVPLWMSLS